MGLAAVVVRCASRVEHCGCKTRSSRHAQLPEAVHWLLMMGLSYSAIARTCKQTRLLLVSSCSSKVVWCRTLYLRHLVRGSQQPLVESTTTLVLRVKPIATARSKASRDSNHATSCSSQSYSAGLCRRCQWRPLSSKSTRLPVHVASLATAAHQISSRPLSAPASARLARTLPQWAQ